MGKDHRGQPSGTNKNEGTGVPVKMPPELSEQSNEQTEKYKEGEGVISGDIRQGHPNRNTDKNMDDRPSYS